MSIIPNRLFRRIFRVVGIVFLLFFILLNLVAYNHAYRFTHTDISLQGEHPQGQVYKMKRASFWTKVGYAFWGISIPKSANENTPTQKFDRQWFVVGKDSIEGWWMPTEIDSPKGVVLVCHGYGGSKSQMQFVVGWWLAKGYHCLSIDFRGHGGSSGNRTTIGIEEAKDVKAAADWIKTEQPDLPLLLFGTSMGSAAIIKAARDYGEDLQAAALVLECPFGTLRQAVLKRFKLMNIPSYGIADLLIFWGGVQHGFWGHGHSPIKYAKRIKTPTLILYGANDPKVGRNEVEAIYENLATDQKQLVVLPCAKHNHLLHNCPELWPQAVNSFLENYL